MPEICQPFLNASDGEAGRRLSRDGSFINELGQCLFQPAHLLGAHLFFNSTLERQSEQGQMIKCRPSRLGQRQVFKPAINVIHATLDEPLFLKRDNSTADLGFVQTGIPTNLLGRQITVPPKMIQNPPFRTEHAILTLVDRLEILADQFSGLVQKVGEKVRKIAGQTQHTQSC